MNTQNIYTGQPTQQCITIDLNALLEYGDTPTAIILTVTIFTFVLFQSLTKLVQGGKGKTQ